MKQKIPLENATNTFGFFFFHWAGTSLFSRVLIHRGRSSIQYIIVWQTQPILCFTCYLFCWSVCSRKAIREKYIPNRRTNYEVASLTSLRKDVANAQIGRSNWLYFIYWTFKFTLYLSCLKPQIHRGRVHPSTGYLDWLFL